MTSSALAWSTRVRRCGRGPDGCPKARIGEHAAASAPPWAVNALGPVPGDPAGRLEWQRRTAAIGAYLGLPGYGHPADPVGPEPAAGDISPIARALAGV